jgi:hypothetical protein
MAKRASSKGKRVTFNQAMKVLASAGVPRKEFGRYNADGNAVIDQGTLEAWQKKLGKKKTAVRFVALNAPFKRRSQIPPA